MQSSVESLIADQNEIALAGHLKSGAGSYSPIELTILMPCLNEVRTLATCIRKAQSFLKNTGIQGEILIADNGSTDGSQVLALSCGARVVEVLRPGYGAALMAGIEAAKGGL